MGSTHPEPGRASTRGRAGECMKEATPVDAVDLGILNTAVL